MEYVPQQLYRIREQDSYKNYEMFFKISAEIEKYTGKAFLECEKYSDLVYKLEWPSEVEKEALAKAKVQPLLLRGVVVDNKYFEEHGMRRLQIVDETRFNGKNVTDAEELHFLREISGKYTLFAWPAEPSRSCTIGALDQIRPGTRIILALSLLELSSSNPQNLAARFADIAIDDDPDFIYIDSDYKIHKTKDYLELYVNLRNNIQKSPSGNTDGSVQKKRVSELDQRYAQYKAELEELAATEGSYDEIRQHYQEAVSHHDTAKRRYDEFLAGLSSSADAHIRKSSQNLADKGKARPITGLIIAGAVFLFLFAPLGICLLAVGIVWAFAYTRSQKSSSLNLAQSHPEFQKIQQDFSEAEQKMMYYKALIEKIKTIENYEKLHRLS